MEILCRACEKYSSEKVYESVFFLTFAGQKNAKKGF